MVKIVSTKEEMIDAYLIRNNVFLVEQKIDPALEFEEEDKTAIHFVKYIDNQAVSTARIVLNNNSQSASNTTLTTIRTTVT